MHPANKLATDEHCANGHRWTAATIYQRRISGGVTRACRECHRIAAAEYRARHRKVAR